MKIQINSSSNLSLSSTTNPVHVKEPPTLLSCGGRPDAYVTALEKHCNGDRAGLYALVMREGEHVQSEALNENQTVRDYLGIGKPDRRSFGTQSTIPYHSAPEAMASAATLLHKEKDADQALTRLAAVLDTHALNAGSDAKSVAYRQSAEHGFLRLLDNFDRLSDAHKQKAANLITRNVGMLDQVAQRSIAVAARKTQDKLAITSDTKLHRQFQYLTRGLNNSNGHRVRVKGITQGRLVDKKDITQGPVINNARHVNIKRLTQGNLISFGSIAAMKRSHVFDAGKKLAQLKAWNWEDEHLDACREAIMRCSAAIDKGMPMQAQLEIAQFNKTYKEYKEYGFVMPKARRSLEQLAAEIELDIRTRKTLQEVTGMLEDSSWSADDLTKLKDATLR